MSVVKQQPDGTWKRVYFRTLVTVKIWATRYGHAWQMHAKTVVVSQADGTIHRYRQVG